MGIGQYSIFNLQYSILLGENKAMMKDPGKIADLKEEWLQDLVEDVVQRLTVKKEMDLLSSAIPKEKNEIEYLKGRAAAARKRLEEAEKLIQTLQPRLAGPRRKLARLREERQSAVVEYKRFKEKKKDIERKFANLPHLKVEIEEFREDVQKSVHALRSLEAGRREALQRRSELEGECKSLEAKLLRIEEEIPVMTNTRDILRGKRPEHFDADTFEEIQGDVEVIVQSYVTDMEGEIEGIKDKISTLNGRFDEKERKEEALLSKKRPLEESVDRLGAEVGEGENRETLRTELDRLEGQKQELAAQGTELKQEVLRLESALKGLDERLVRERTFEGETRSRHSALTSRKEEMGNLQNVGEEIRRLEDETERLHLDTEVNRRLDHILSGLAEDAAPMVEQLRASLEEYDRIFGEFEQEIKAILS